MQWMAPFTSSSRSTTIDFFLYVTVVCVGSPCDVPTSSKRTGQGVMIWVSRGMIAYFVMASTMLLLPDFSEPITWGI